MKAILNNISPSPNPDLEKEKIAVQQALHNWVTLYRGYLDIFLDAYCIVDTSNRVIEFNTAFTELCGESYRKILKIGNFCELIKTEMCPHQCPAHQVLVTTSSIRIDEIKGSSKAYPELHMIIGGVPILSEDRKPLGSLITIRNVTAEKELQKKYDERKKDSITDGLTRLYNKIYTESVLQRMVKTALRDDRAMSVVMCDVDHFKQVNDIYGHQAGDHVLATVAQMLKQESRDSDVVGRFGGEEFLAVLHNSDATGAKIFAERFRKRIENTKIYFGEKHIPLTVSLGTATFKENWAPGYSPENTSKELINRADTALYLAKANGRNQTWQFEMIPTKKK